MSNESDAPTKPQSRATNTLWNVSKFVVVIVAFCWLSARRQYHPFSAARRGSRKISDAGNLKQIGLAVRMYSADHEGWFPPDFGHLFDTGYLTAGKVYTSPRADTEPPMTGDEIRAGQCDYLYFGCGLNEETASAGTVIGANRPGLYRSEFTMVLFGDGHVKGFTKPPPEVVELRGR